MSEPTPIPEQELTLMRFSEVTPERIDWVWKPFIARGFLTILEGDPGQGKGLLTIDLAARLTRGAELPGPNPQPSREATVVFVTSEDSRAGTEVPRALAAGANLTRIVAISGLEAYGRDITVVADQLVQRIKSLVSEEENLALVVLDPIEEALPGLTDYNAAMARVALSTLLQFAQEYNCAIVGVRHLSKGPTTSPMYRGRGSIALTAAARMVYLLGRDTSDPDLRVLAPIKNNLEPLPHSLTFRIVSPVEGQTAPSIEWMGETPLSAMDIVSHSGSAAAGRAEQFLQEHLVEPKTLAELLTIASPLGISENALWRAKSKLRVLSVRDGKSKPARWLWRLPEEDAKKTPAKQLPAEPSDPKEFLQRKLAAQPFHEIDLLRMAAKEGITEAQFIAAAAEVAVKDANRLYRLMGQQYPSWDLPSK